MAKKNVSHRRAERGRRIANNRSEAVGAEFSTFALEEEADSRVLRSSLWLAAGVHLILLLINFPSFQSEVRAVPEKEKTIFVIQEHRWEEPKVPKTTIPPKMIKRMPVPDQTPHEPEPIRLEEPRTDFDLPEVDPDYFVIPSAPPAPPEEGPIFVVGEVTKPVKTHAPQPAYTEIARKARIQGLVIVQAIIDKGGEVTNVKVIKGLPMGLTEAAVNAIKEWKFKPATLRGKPVDVYYNLTVNFKLM